MAFDPSTAVWESDVAEPAPQTEIVPKTKFDPSTAEWETGKFDPSTAVLETDGNMTPEQRDLVADGIAESISATTGAPKFITKLILTKGGKPGDIAANVIFPMAGSAIGGITGGPGGAVAGGMAGGAAGDTVSQTREILRGERADFSVGELAGSTVVSGFTPAKVVGGVAKTVATRGLQGAGLGTTQETIKELIDKGELDLGQIAQSAAWGAGFGAIFGGLEKAAPALFNKLRNQPPKQALETLAAEPKTPETEALAAEIQQRDMSPETAARNELNTKLQQPVKVQAMGPDGQVEVELPAAEALKRVEAQAKSESDAIYKQAGVEPPKAPEATQTPIEPQNAPETTGAGNADVLPPAEMPMSAEAQLTVAENPIADYQRYRQIQSEMSRLTKAGKTFDNPEVKALWAENEQIKNRNSSDPGMPPEAPPQAVESTFQKFSTRFREIFEDDKIRLKKLMEGTGIVITDEGNPLQRMRLLPGRVGAAIEAKNNFAEGFVKDVRAAAKQADLPTKKLATDVNAYLQARHAPERNAQLGDGAAGMTDAQAADVLSQIEASPTGPEVKRLANTIQDFHNQTLDVLLEGQLITPELYGSLRKQYPNHVPLNRILPESDDVGPILGGRGLDVKSSGLKKALGSDLPVDDIVGNVLTNYEQAVIRAEKNRVDLATLKFARENPQLDLFELAKRKAIGTTFDGKGVILAEMKDPQVLTMREKGEPVYLRIKDPALAPVIRGINREQLPGWLRFVGGFTRLYSGLQTRFNPEFAIPNKLRDIQEAVVYMGAQPEIGAVGAAKTALDTGSMKDVLDLMRGKETPGARLYQQMKDDGGTTGGMGLSTRSANQETLDALWRRIDSTPRKAANAALQLVDNFNGIFEDSTRLSIYKRALEAGASRERAAFMAKEGTVDFNRMGTAGPIVNALYMFSNASIQGSAKMLRAMKNPKVAAAVITTVGGTVAAVNEWNNRIDPEWKNKVSPWDKINSLPVMLPPKEGSKEVRYLAVPVSWGLKPIKVAADKTIDLMEGNATAGQGVVAVAQAVVEGYNPAGGTDIMQAITPTILDLPLDLSRNKKWSGARIKPDSDPNAPESVRYFPNERKTALGRGLIDVTQDLSKSSDGRIEVSPADVHYALSTLVGGAGRLGEKVVNTTKAIAQGEAPATSEIPMVSRILRDVPEDRQAGRDPALDKALTEQARGRFYEREQAQDFIDGLAKLPPDQKQAKLNALTDEEYDRVERAALKKAMPFEVSRMKQLGVNNGARAIYLAERIKKMPQADRAAFYDSLVEDKVISDQVQEQLDALLSAKK